MEPPLRALDLWHSNQRLEHKLKNHPKPKKFVCNCKFSCDDQGKMVLHKIQCIAETPKVSVENDAKRIKIDDINPEIQEFKPDVHIDQSSEEMEKIETAKKVKMYFCYLCEKHYTLKHNLKSHFVKIHKDHEWDSLKVRVEQNVDFRIQVNEDLPIDEIIPENEVKNAEHSQENLEN